MTKHREGCQLFGACISEDASNHPFIAEAFRKVKVNDQLLSMVTSFAVIASN